ncbi:MAG: SusC/RagA family TonB-linked outer membrane protein [Gemmatimonadetes bacterium]|nr:SusC/RagA family TonB-linked outer membrane protein [Gemmatimonadota bacterium]
MNARRFGMAWSLAFALVAAAPTFLQAQGTITGRVTQSNTMRPLAGAQVSIPGSGIGALANADGRFLLVNVPAGQKSVRAEIIGFGTQEKTVTVTAGQTVQADFLLETQALGLDEIVVTGTAGGQQRRAIGNVVGAFNTEKALELSAPKALQQMLAGQVAGVNVSIGGANVGGGGSVMIRGTGSLALGTGPLLYIDGVRANNQVVTQNNGVGSSRMNDINPEDIERIEIIKGPAAATLYGTEASNGVIQIITKKGALGSRARVDAIVRAGGQWFMNPADRIPDNWGLAADGKTILRQNLYADETAAGRKLFRTGRLSSYGLNVRGGQEKLSYFLSGNLDADHGYHFNNALDRTSVRSNLQLAVTDELDVSADIGVIRSETTFAQAGTSGTSGLIPMILWGSPLSKDLPQRGFMVGPAEYQDDVDVREQLNRATASSTIGYRATKWLAQRLVAGFDWTDNAQSTLYPKLPIGTPAFYAGNSNGDKSINNVRDLNQTIDYNLTASFEPWAGITSATSGGVQYFYRSRRNVGATGNQFPTPAVTTISSASVKLSSETYTENKTFGTFVQETFGWHNQAFLTAAIRADANSAFGADFKAAYYPKLSGTWVVSDADFWSFDFVNSFRVRGAWGKSGLQPDALDAIRTWQPTVGPADQPAVTPDKVGNVALKPEIGVETELGFDASFLQNKVSTEVTYYRKFTKDAILEELVAPSSGFSGARRINAGEVSNQGWELKLDLAPVQTQAIALNVGATISFNTNKIEDMAGKTIQADTRGRWQHVEGYPVGSMWTKHIASAEWGGPDKKTLINIKCVGGPGGGVKNLPESEAGKYPVQACADAPFFYWGNPGPGRNGSLNSSLTVFNNLTLSTSFVYIGDTSRFNTTEWYRDKTQNSSERSVQLRLGQLDPVVAAGIQLVDFEESWFERDDFFRMRDLSLSYSLPGSLISGFGVSRASLTVSGTNLWTPWVHSSFRASGMDPEAKKPVESGRNYNWQQTQAPLPASLVTVLRVSF